MRRYIRNPRFREPDNAGTVRDETADGQQDEQQDNEAAESSDEEGGQEKGGT